VSIARLALLPLILLLALPAPARPAAAPPAAPDDRVATLEAMRGELSRSMERLRLQGYETPSFISY
jgi:TldD protein